MNKFLSLLAAFALLSPLSATTGFSAEKIGTVDVDGSRLISLGITSSSPDLQNLAIQAFRVHGAYRVVAGSGAYNINFAAVTDSQIRVTITKGGTQVHSEVATGTSRRNALYRAADVAVKATSGLKGFFAGKLTFISEASGKPEVCVSDLFFGEAYTLTKDHNLALMPRWSPDGRYIVYTSYFGTGFPDIYRIDVAGAHRTTLVSLKGTNSSARYSPNGSQLAMVLSGEGNPDIYVGNSAGKGIRRITSGPGVKATPTWSPDGSRIAFTSDSRGKAQIFTMSSSGGGASPLPTGVSNYCAEPDWCRWDGSKLAFTAGVGRGFQIAIYDFNTGKGKIVSRAPVDAVEPTWLADGRHLVYTTRAANNRNLWILDTESDKATRISSTSLGSVSQANFWMPCIRAPS